MLIMTGRLSWADLQARPAELPAERVRELVLACVLEASAAGLPDRDALEARIDTALLVEFGPWIAGWNWAASEPGCGGPVREYCCPRDSLLQGDDPVANTAERVTLAVGDWHAFLRELEADFAALRPEVEALEIDAGVELAAGRLLPRVLERTHAEDAWYATFSTVLTWFLESLGHDARDVGPAVGGVVNGRFESWITPAESLVASTLHEVGGAVLATLEQDPDEEDALQRWLALRDEPLGPRATPTVRRPVAGDAHAAFVDRVDAARDPARGAHLVTALAACRAAARGDAPLDFDLLQRWQCLVLGAAQAPFRDGPAFAKGGRERYGWTPGTQARFARCLAEANDVAVDPVERAARAYLDVCCFHPFADGNARAARLALEFVLTRAGLALHTCAPVFVMSRSIRGRSDAYCFWLALDQLVGAAPA